MTVSHSSKWNKSMVNPLFLRYTTRDVDRAIPDPQQHTCTRWLRKIHPRIDRTTCFFVSSSSLIIFKNNIKSRNKFTEKCSPEWHRRRCDDMSRVACDMQQRSVTDKSLGSLRKCNLTRTRNNTIILAEPTKYATRAYYKLSVKHTRRV